MDKLIYRWEDLERDCKTLAEKIQKDKIHYTRIVAVTRGGLFVAGLLSQFLDVVPIDTVSIRSHYGRVRKKMAILKETRSHEPVLICEDTIRTGKTINEVKKMYPNGIIVSLHYKTQKSSTIKPDYFFLMNPKVWICYPWEINEQ